MKITLDLPDWVDERNLRIFAGMEPVAIRRPGGQWQIKTSRCSQCGRCCTNLGPNHMFPLIHGQCIYLTKQPGKHNPRWDCGLGLARPYACCAATSTAPHCTIRYEPAPNEN